MISVLASLAIVSSSADTILEVNPTDDVWVYPHASDVKDPYLRVWGTDGAAVATNSESAQNLSYSYIRFEVPSKPWENRKVKEVTLTIWHVAEAGWDAEASKNAPLEVRLLNKPFDEKSWNYDLVATVTPNKDKVIAKASADPKAANQQPFAIKFDLLGKVDTAAGEVPAFVPSANDGTLCLALTSKIDPSEQGKSGVYKFYSKDAEKQYRPILRIVAE